MPWPRGSREVAGGRGLGAGNREPPDVLRPGLRQLQGQAPWADDLPRDWRARRPAQCHRKLVIKNPGMCYYKVTLPPQWGSLGCEPPKGWAFILLASEAPRLAWMGPQAGCSRTALPQTAQDDTKGDPASEKLGNSACAAPSQKFTPLYTCSMRSPEAEEPGDLH